MIYGDRRQHMFWWCSSMQSQTFGAFDHGGFGCAHNTWLQWAEPLQSISHRLTVLNFVAAVPKWQVKTTPLLWWLRHWFFGDIDLNHK